MKWQITNVKNVMSAGTNSSAWMFSLVFHSAIIFLFVVITPRRELRTVREPKPISASVVYKSTFVAINSQKQATDSNANAKPHRPVNNKILPLRVRPVVAVSSSNNSIVVMPMLGEATNQTGRSEFVDGSFGPVRAHPELLNLDDIKVPYPEQARQMMIEGIVKMRLTVSEAGRVIDAQILSGPYYGLRNAALIVARKLFFLPATDEQGHARTTDVMHEVVFRLNKRS